MKLTWYDRHNRPKAPEGVDYERWLGPAPVRPFNPRRFHFGFYFWWDYAGGMVSDWGVHLFDIVLWAMGSDILSVAATGGTPPYTVAFPTPPNAGASIAPTLIGFSGGGFQVTGLLDTPAGQSLTNITVTDSAPVPAVVIRSITCP